MSAPVPADSGSDAAPASVAPDGGSAPAPRRCRNCGARRTTPFCGECGQKAERRAVPLSKLGTQLLAEVFSFDTRFLRTLGPLLVKPGFLAKEYFAGRRKRYAPPLRLYVFVSFVYFLLFALPGVGADDIEQAEAEINELEVIAPDSLSTSPGEARRYRATAEKKARRFAQAVLAGWQTLRDHLSVVFFALIPLMALALVPLYWRVGRLYVHHLVFIVHAHAFWFVAGLPAIVLEAALPASVPDWPAGALKIMSLVAFAAYVLLAMKRFYQQSWGRTLFKAVLLAMAYFAAFSAGMLMLVAYAFFRMA